MARNGERRVARALLSVSDAKGLADLAEGLRQLSVELWATSGTRKVLADAGIPATATEERTGVGDWFGGRVKTLHPALLGGILAPRTPEGEQELRDRGLVPIDLVVVNFYPFTERWAATEPMPTLVEAIDVGGVTLARAAAKNHAEVAVATDPSEYGPLLAELRQDGGRTSAATRRTLAAAAFARCAAYDTAIASALGEAAAPGPAFPEAILLRREASPLRYGENPHQAAAAYRIDAGARGIPPALSLELLQGERLSYTNLLDLDTAVRIVGEFAAPTAAVVKHATPCGVASGSTSAEAIANALATDPVARYGCALAVNRPFDLASAAALAGVFVDLVVAPSYDDDARARLARRAKAKVVVGTPPAVAAPFWDVHAAAGRWLVQQGDRRQLRPEEFRVVAGTPLDPPTTAALDFAWRVVRHAKSNAVVLADGPVTVGIGSGQTSRVKAVEIACEIAGPRAKGAVLASDAFFPFPDGVEAAGRAGVAAILQPGGSLRDPEVMAAAERFGIRMAFTGWRVFRH